MRQKTKEELTKLAEILVTKYRNERISNTGQLMRSALSEARRHSIELDRKSITKYAKWLEEEINAVLESEWEAAFEEKTHENLDNDSLYDCWGVAVDDIEILDRAIGIMQQFIFKKTSEHITEGPHIPEYTMFVEGEDGLIVIKGTYKGKTIDEIDVVNFTGAKRGWAKWCLEKDTNLSDDDRAVFTKILEGKL